MYRYLMPSMVAALMVAGVGIAGAQTSSGEQGQAAETQMQEPSDGAEMQGTEQGATPSGADEGAMKSRSATDSAETQMNGGAAQQAAEQSTGKTLTDEQVQAWIDQPVYSSDGMRVGEVAAILRDADNTVTEVHADIGGFLGLGETRVRVKPDQFRMDGEQITLDIPEAEVDALDRVE